MKNKIKILSLVTMLTTLTMALASADILNYQITIMDQALARSLGHSSEVKYSDLEEEGEYAVSSPIQIDGKYYVLTGRHEGIEPDNTMDHCISLKIFDQAELNYPKKNAQGNYSLRDLKQLYSLGTVIKEMLADYAISKGITYANEDSTILEDKGYSLGWLTAISVNLGNDLTFYMPKTSADDVQIAWLCILREYSLFPPKTNRDGEWSGEFKDAHITLMDNQKQEYCKLSK